MLPLAVEDGVPGRTVTAEPQGDLKITGHALRGLRDEFEVFVDSNVELVTVVWHRVGRESVVGEVDAGIAPAKISQTWPESFENLGISSQLYVRDGK